MVLDSATKKCVGQLHKGEGVWRPGLRGQLTETQLGTLWGIASTPAPSDLELVCTVIYRLEEVIRTRSPREQLALPGLYNIICDDKLRPLKLQGRQSEISRRYPDQALSLRNQLRILETFQQTLLASLHAPLHPVDNTTLLTIVRREQRFSDKTADFVGPATFRDLVRRAYISPVSEPLDAFLRVRVSFWVSSSGQPIIARSPTLGDWLCVFTDQQGLAAHETATKARRPQATEIRTTSGAELIALARALDLPIGILVDPPSHPEHDSRCALEITPEDIAELARRFPMPDRNRLN
jgi:hypothetical protein